MTDQTCAPTRTAAKIGGGLFLLRSAQHYWVGTVSVTPFGLPPVRRFGVHLPFAGRP